MGALKVAQASEFAQHLQNEDTRMHVLLGIERERNRAQENAAVEDAEAVEAQHEREPGPRVGPRQPPPSPSTSSEPRTKSVLESLRNKLQQMG